MIEGDSRSKYQPSIEAAVEAENERVIRRFANEHERSVGWVKQRLENNPKFLIENRNRRQLLLSKLERDEIGARDLLALTLDEIAETKTEKKRIAEYRGRLDEQSKYLKKIDKLRDELYKLNNHKGDRDIEQRKKDIRAEIKSLHYKVTELDSELLRLQNLRSLRNVVKRTAERLVEESHLSDEMYYYRKLAEKDRQHQGQIIKFLKYLVHRIYFVL